MALPLTGKNPGLISTHITTIPCKIAQTTALQFFSHTTYQGKLTLVLEPAIFQSGRWRLSNLCHPTDTLLVKNNKTTNNKNYLDYLEECSCKKDLTPLCKGLKNRMCIQESKTKTCFVTPCCTCCCSIGIFPGAAFCNESKSWHVLHMKESQVCLL